jgi:hypothetical protein
MFQCSGILVSRSFNAEIMKNFPFKTLFLCIFLPPVFYILTLQVLEGYLKKRETEKLNEVIIQKYEALYQGRYSVKDEVNRNINAYLSRSLAERLGVRIDILVKTKDDRILYPSQYPSRSTAEKQLSDSQFASLRYMDVATENYRILTDGLVLLVNVQIGYNSWLANGILVGYIFIALIVLQRFVLRALRESDRQEKKQRELIQNLSGQLAAAESKLGEVEAKEKEYLQKIGELRKEKSGLTEDVDSLLEEMEKQESGLEEQKRLKGEMELQVLQLREELERLKERSEKPKKKRKTEEATKRRFAVLYKNLLFTDRAVEGFLGLTEDFQLKAEEVIHKIDGDDSAISVKRKVFGKGGKMDVLEVAFSYSGRIYYQKDSHSKKTVFAIGTKNTQEKDLAYLETAS